MPSSRGSSQPRDRIQVSRTAGGFFTVWAARVAGSSIQRQVILTCRPLPWALPPPTVDPESGMQERAPSSAGGMPACL